MTRLHMELSEQRSTTTSFHLSEAERAWLLTRAAERAATNGSRPSMGDVVRELIREARTRTE